MTVYQCPRCGKGLVTEDPEPPGIIHICDDCVETMKPDEADSSTTETAQDGDSHE